MAEYRQIHTRIWKDSWFLSLEPAHKLLFIYLFGNERASVAGIYELPLPVICFETGLDESVVQAGLAVFIQAGKVVYENDVVWVVNLRKYNDSGSGKVRVKIDKDIAAVPAGIVKTLYTEHYQSRYPIQQRRANKNKKKKEKKKKNRNRKPLRRLRRQRPKARLRQSLLPGNAASQASLSPVARLPNGKKCGNG